MTELLTFEVLSAFVTLVFLEIVLGIDNLVFIAIITERLPPEKRSFGRRVGLFLAMIMRVGLLFSISWVMGMKEPLFTVFEHPVSLRDLILLVGGMFLIAKATHEIHEKVALDSDGGDPTKVKAPKHTTLKHALIQIIMIDLVFSLDSVITAVGMVDQVWIMIAAVIISVLVMIAFANWISDFVAAHPTFKMLALSFLVLIGCLLVAEGAGQHIPKGYVYFAMGFSLFVEMLNQRMSKKASRTHLMLK